MTKEEIYRKCEQFLSCSKEKQQEILSSFSNTQREVFFSYLDKYQNKIIDFNTEFLNVKPESQNSNKDKILIIIASILLFLLIIFLILDKLGYLGYFDIGRIIGLLYFIPKIIY